MKAMRLSAMIPAAAFAAVAAVFGVYLHQIGTGAKDVAVVPSALIGKPAPQFDLPPIEGMEEETGGLSTADLPGQAALVNVFASWCPPCHQEHPFLMQLARSGVAIYGIDYKDPPTDARAFLRKKGNPYRRVGADTTGRAAIEWGVYGYPETFVLDRTGRIRYRHVGPILAGDLETRILPLLEELGE